MKVIYQAEWSDHSPRTIHCDAFEEFEHGVVLYDVEDEQIAYIPHDRLLVIEPESR